MILTNFRLMGNRDAIVAIESGGRIWDLHGFGEFTRFSYEVAKSSVECVWKYTQNDQYAIDIRHVTYIYMLFSMAYRFDVTPRDPDVPYTEDLCLDQIAWINSTDVFSGNLEEGIPISNPLDINGAELLFVFRGGQTIRIGCETVTLTLKN